MGLKRLVISQILCQNASEIGESINTKRYRIKKLKGRIKLAMPINSRGKKGSRIPKPSKPGIGNRLMMMEVICKNERKAIAIKNFWGTVTKKKKNGKLANGSANAMASNKFAIGPAAETRLRYFGFRNAKMLIYTAPPGKPIPPKSNITTGMMTLFSALCKIVFIIPN